MTMIIGLKSSKQRMVVVISITVAVMKICLAQISDIPGQARPDDPNACPWFTGVNGSSIFRCCDGYFKLYATNLTENCIECPGGLYGFFCHEKCKLICKNGGTCNTVNGTCICPPEYFGNKCQYPCNCQNGANCTRGGKCVCADGFYGKLCHRNCSCPENSLCNIKTGECVCQDGFYGSSCLSCNCSNNRQCDPFTGECSCRPGFFGDNCEKQCSCFNGAQCSNDHSKRCKCSSGWTGPTCTDCDPTVDKFNQFCEGKCLHCFNGNKCSLKSGDCLCSPGWQGNRCDKKCDLGFFGNNCSDVCLCKDGMCNHITGICHCESEEPLEHCEDQCPDNCLVCEDSICMSCKSGWTGEHCSNRCKPGFHGDSCKQTCIECNCSTSCHHITGSCQEDVRCEEHKCRYRNARICMENPFKLVCQDGWTGRFCNMTISLKTNKDISQTVGHGTTLNPTGDESIADLSNLHTLLSVPVIVIFTLGVVGFIVIVFRRRILQLFRTIHGKNRRPKNKKEFPTTGYDDDTSKPHVSTLSVAVTGNISEFDSFIVNDIIQTHSKAKPIYASVSKHKKRTQQSNAIKENSEDAEPVEPDSLINSKETISTCEDYAIKASAFKGPYETISLDKLSLNTTLSGNDTSCDNMFDGICTKQHNINTDDGAYELLSDPRQDTMIVHMNA